MQKKVKRKIDEVDISILSALQQNCKISNVQLSRKVYLSESACLRRVQILENSGIFEQYVLLLNQSALGIHNTIFVRVALECQQQKTLNIFEDNISKIEEVLECYLVSGEYDYAMKIVCIDNDDYKRIHTILTNLPGVRRVRSSFALRTIIKKNELPIRMDAL